MFLHFDKNLTHIKYMYKIRFTDVKKKKKIISLVKFNVRKKGSNSH